MNIMEEIVARKKQGLPELRFRAKQVKKRTRPAYSLMERLTADRNLSVIAEIKRGSPSRGLFAPDLDIRTQARAYQDNGACAVSILTDEAFFGSMADLEALAPILTLPVLAKDFIIDSAQITLAHAAGADVVLLIAAVLIPSQIQDLKATADSLGMEVILEFHDPAEMPLDAVPPGVIVGLNNRNLKTFEVSLQNGLRHIPALKALGAPLIAESGIHTPEEAKLLSAAGYSGLLIGESLIRHDRPQQLLRAFAGIPRRCGHDTR